MVEGTGKRLVSYPAGAIRQTRGGTPDIRKIARRGEGGVRLPIGDGRWSGMTEADVNLGLKERAILVDGRKQYSIEEVELSPKTSAPLDLGLLFDLGSNMVAGEKEVTIGEMRQFVEETGYKPEPESHKADKFSKKIGEDDASAPMVFTNEEDCLAFIKWALPKAKAQDPRIQTLRLPSGAEWVNMRQAFGKKQSGDNWERLSDGYFRSFHLEGRLSYGSRESRYYNYAFRLVGTYKKD